MTQPLFLDAASHADRLSPSADLDVVSALVDDVRDPDLAATRNRMQQLLRDRPRPLDRRERPGHFTGSALVVDADANRTLVMLHTKLGIWVQPGGHADGDANLAGVALREATEETGVDGLRVWPEPIDLDIHHVDPPGEDPHEHFDVRFLVVAPPEARAEGNHESRELRWVEIDELDDIDADVSLHRLARVGFERARKLC